MGETMETKETKTQPNNHRRTVLTEVQGWIPLIDHLVQKYDLITAAVFGRVWRYSQMWNGVCRASLPTIAGDLNLSRYTVRKAIIRLCEDGYLIDLTPQNNSGRVHIYRDTGKVAIASRFSVELTTESEPLQNIEGSAKRNGKPLQEIEGALQEIEGYPSSKSPEPLQQIATNHKSLLKESLNHKDPPPSWFSDAMRQLESAMPQAPYQTYVASLEFISETDNLVLLQSPTDYSAQWCASRLTAQLNRMLTGMRNHPTEIVFTSQE
jgi:hypothetical protein